MISSLNCSTFQNFTLQKLNFNEEKKEQFERIGGIVVRKYYSTLFGGYCTLKIC